MALPTAGQAWPPAALDGITQRYAEWDAWYAGDPDGLATVYADHARTPVDKVAQYRGGVTGRLARMWWGRPVGDLTRRTADDKLHVPIATDLCQASADLLFAEPPTLSGSEKKITDELDKAVEQGAITRLAEGAEVGAALGDIYYRVTWDTAVADRSFITAIHADAAYPEFRWGRLVAVTFWWKLSAGASSSVYRHVERHELDGNGIGIVLHGLYEGRDDNLGRLVPLTEHPATRGLAPLVDADGAISTLTPGLAVVQAPNQRPQRRWRKHPVGASLGRSDLDGVEGLMDKLDMVYSSWMRDVRLARSRLIVPSYMLDSLGPGRGASFDDDQDVFTPVAAPPREDGGTQITPQQFAIRVADHQATAQQLIEDVLRTAGYSRQTFGEGDDVAMTATEVTSKDRRTALTRDRKIRTMQPALVELLVKKLRVDAALFGSGVSVPDAAAVKVEFVDASQVDPKVLAETSEIMFRAQSASAKTRVQIQHPDWDETRVDQEVAAILAEFSVAVPDPTGFRPGGAPASSTDGGEPVDNPLTAADQA